MTIVKLRKIILKNMRSKKKIFGIGFHKTGTSSLRKALKLLGYKVTGPNGINDPNISANAHQLADSLVSRFDAFQDNPWPIIYREIDERYAGSRFILTIRPTEDWINSVVRHFGSVSTPMREWIYGHGAPLGNEEAYIKTYEKHNREVLEYFKNRSNDFLILRITDGDGWANICEFLKMPIPITEFPHLNDSGKRGVWRRIRSGLF